MSSHKKHTLPPEALKFFQKKGSIGGRKGTHADKVRAGKLGQAARLAKLKEQVAKELAEQDPPAAAAPTTTPTPAPEPQPQA